MVLIGLIVEYFRYNFQVKKISSHVLNVTKRDILNIMFISGPEYVTRVKLNSCSSFDLSKLKSLGKLDVIFAVISSVYHYLLFILIRFT